MSTHKFNIAASSPTLLFRRRKNSSCVDCWRKKFLPLHCQIPSESLLSFFSATSTSWATFSPPPATSIRCCKKPVFAFQLSLRCSYRCLALSATKKKRNLIINFFSIHFGIEETRAHNFILFHSHPPPGVQTFPLCYFRRLWVTS